MTNNIDYKKDEKVINFYERYIQKYAAEITDFQTDIKVTEEDNEFFFGILKVIDNPTLYSENHVKSVLDLYEAKDGLANFIVFGLLKIKDKQFYIDSKKLAQKAFEYKNVSELTDNYKDEVVCVYTKGSKK